MEVAVSGSGAFAVSVVGVAQYQRVLEAAAEEGTVVDAVLILENDNPHDDQAVAVHLNQQRAGYLSRTDARRFRADLAAAGEPALSVRVKSQNRRRLRNQERRTRASRAQARFAAAVRQLNP